MKQRPTHAHIYRNLHVLSFLLLLVTIVYWLTAQAAPLVVSIGLSGIFAGLTLLVFTHPSFLSKYVPRDSGIGIAIARMLTSGYLLYHLTKLHFFNTMQLPSELIYSGTFMSLLQHIPGFNSIPTNLVLQQLLFATAVVSLVFTFIGYKTTYAAPIAVLSFTAVSGSVLQYFNMWHEGTLPLYILAALVFLPCADRYTLDSYLKNKPKKDTLEYGFSLYCVWVVITLVYLSLGASKLLHSGLAWVAADNVRGHLLRGYAGPGDAMSNLLVHGPDTLFVAAGIFTLAIQILFPLVLISHWMRTCISAGAILLSIGIAVIMNIYFYDLILIELLLFLVVGMIMRIHSQRASLAPKVSIPRRYSLVLGGVLFVGFFQWHAYIEQYPFSSWDMYSGESQFEESRYKKNGTLHRMRTYIQYADGSLEQAAISNALGTYAEPRKCKYGFNDQHTSACQIYFDYVSLHITSEYVTAFELQSVVLAQDATNHFNEYSVERFVFPIQ